MCEWWERGGGYRGQASPRDGEKKQRFPLGPSAHERLALRVVLGFHDVRGSTATDAAVQPRNRLPLKDCEAQQKGQGTFFLCSGGTLIPRTNKTRPRSITIARSIGRPNVPRTAVCVCHSTIDGHGRSASARAHPISLRPYNRRDVPVDNYEGLGVSLLHVCG